jgi:uncharacterized protein YfdQ (DUF2303 family)
VEEPIVRTEAAAVAQVVKDHIRHEVIQVDDPNGSGAVPVLVLPKELVGHSVKKFFDEYRTEPERRTGTAKLADLDSFIAHVMRFADADSALFADPEESGPVLLAVLDYHKKESDGSPAFCCHRSQYDFPLSDEWKAWTGKNAKEFRQQAFAEFLEDRIQDVLDPAEQGESAKAFAARLECTFAGAAKLLELSRGLTVRVGAQVSRHQNLATGERAVEFVTTHTGADGAPLKVPSAFLIALPVFKGGALYQVAVRLRYRVNGGDIVWFYELSRADAVFQDAFRGCCEEARKCTSLPLFVGTPEV